MEVTRTTLTPFVEPDGPPVTKLTVTFRCMDRFDAEQLLQLLTEYVGGDDNVLGWSMLTGTPT